MPTPQATDQYWSNLYQNGRDFSLMTSDALSKVLSFTDGDMAKICLDIGCGTGQLTRELYHRGYSCIGIDASTSAIKIARSLTTLPQNRLSYRRFDITHDDTRELPERQYSIITCRLVYAFIEEKRAFLEKVSQLLAPGGLFVIITPHIDSVPVDRQNIAVDDNELALLGSHFERIALYEDRDALTYFIGRRRNVLAFTA